MGLLYGKKGDGASSKKPVGKSFLPTGFGYYYSAREQ